jgi:hypothetical protein
VMVALPAPVFGLLFGREWFIEPGPAAPTAGTGHVLALVEAIGTDTGEEGRSDAS